MKRRGRSLNSKPLPKGARAWRKNRAAADARAGAAVAAQGPTPRKRRARYYNRLSERARREEVA